MSDLKEVEVLVVGGGGAGGQDIGGGGGAGGVVYEPSYSVAAGESIEVVVGGGGLRPLGPDTQGAGTELQQELKPPMVFATAGTFFVDLEPGTYTVKAWGGGGGGAAGGSNGDGAGGAGGAIIKTGINVSSKERWQIYVGEGGKTATGDAAGGTAQAGAGGAGYGAGGAGAGGGTIWGGGGGGGSTAILGPSINGVLIAAGGGGAGSNGSLAGFATGGGASNGTGGLPGKPMGKAGTHGINGGGGGGGSNGLLDSAGAIATTGPDRLIVYSTGKTSNRGMSGSFGLNPKFFPVNLDGSYQTATFNGHMTYGNNDTQTNDDWTAINAFDGSFNSRAWVSPRESDNYTEQLYGQWTFPDAVTFTAIYIMPRDLRDGFPSQVEVYVDDILVSTAKNTTTLVSGESGHSLNYSGAAFKIEPNANGKKLKLVFTAGSKSYANEVGVYIGELEFWGYTSGGSKNSVPASDTGVGGQGGKNQSLSGVAYIGSSGGNKVQAITAANASDISYVAPAAQGGVPGGDGNSGRVVIIQTQIGGGSIGSTVTNANGGNSKFGDIVALGGGGGGGSASPNAAGSGGSGGGAGGNIPAGLGAAGQGYPGASTSVDVGGGGGGASEAGKTTGFGGNGLPYSISGTLTYYGGGGGGTDVTNLPYLGGLGGGGTNYGYADPRNNGADNTGGGGSAYHGPWGGAGNGGSGVVIVRYPTPQRAQGGNVNIVDGFVIHKFTAVGSQRFLPDITVKLDITGISTTVTPAGRVSGGITVLNNNGTLQNLTALSAFTGLSVESLATSGLGQGCDGPVALSEYYAGGGIVRSGTIGYPDGERTVIPDKDTIAIKNFYGAMTGYYYIMAVDPNTNSNIASPQQNKQIRFDVKSIRETEKLYYTVESPSCYNIDSFVAQFRGSYTAEVFKTQALKIYPLYVSNNKYDLPNGRIKYGLYRYPDTNGLGYWTTTTLVNNIDPESTAFYEIFFSASSAAENGRELTPNKSFDPTTSGCGFADDGRFIAPIPIPTPIPVPVPVGVIPTPVLLPVPVPVPTPPPPPPTQYTIQVLPAIAVFTACQPVQISITGGPPNSPFGIIKKGPSGSLRNGTGLDVITNLTLNGTGRWSDAPGYFTVPGNYNYVITFNPPAGTEIVGGNEITYSLSVNPVQQLEIQSVTTTFKSGDLISVGIRGPAGFEVSWTGPTQGTIAIPPTGVITVYIITASDQKLNPGNYTWRFSVANRENCYAPKEFTASIISSAPPPPPPTATYILKSNVTVVNEGNAFRITLDTTNLNNGTKVPYTITGITANDLVGTPLQGEFTITSNFASATFVANADLTTEGIEVLVLTLDKVFPTVSTSVVINDTSLGSTSVPGGTVNWTTVCPTDLNGYNNTVLNGITGTVTNNIANVTASLSATGGVWGDNVNGYPTGTSFPKAVIHAGLLSNGQTGQIRFTSLGSKTDFKGSTNNGITSSAAAGPYCAVQLSLVAITGGVAVPTPGGTPGTPGGGTPGTPGGGTPGTPGGGTPGTPTPGTPTPGTPTPSAPTPSAPKLCPQQSATDPRTGKPCGQEGRIVYFKADAFLKGFDYEFSGTIESYEIRMFIADTSSFKTVTNARAPEPGVRYSYTATGDMNSNRGKSLEYQIVCYEVSTRNVLTTFNSINGYADKSKFTGCDCVYMPPWSVRLRTS